MPSCCEPRWRCDAVPVPASAALKQAGCNLGVRACPPPPPNSLALTLSPPLALLRVFSMALHGALLMRSLLSMACKADAELLFSCYFAA
jgi:hypothetical protein